MAGRVPVTESNGALSEERESKGSPPQNRIPCTVADDDGIVVPMPFVSDDASLKRQSKRRRYHG
jgi:hypothetical protein